jgi:hypothetical protein
MLPTKRMSDALSPLVSSLTSSEFHPQRLPQFAFFFDLPAVSFARLLLSPGICYLSLSGTRLLHRSMRVSFYISTPDTGNPRAGNQSDANGCGTKVTVDFSRSRRNVFAIRFSLTSKDPSETIIRNESRKFASREKSPRDLHSFTASSLCSPFARCLFPRLFHFKLSNARR